MRIPVRLLGTAAVAVSLLAAARAPGSDVPLRNWDVPRATLADLGNPTVFVPVTPCRIADTRGVPPFTGSYAGPQLAANAIRTFGVVGAPTCTGIPANAPAFSLNFTVIGSAGGYQNAFLTVWPAGDAQPTVSTLNFDGGQLKANAAIVPAGTGGGVSVFVNAAAHLIIDINGYFINSAGDLTTGSFFGVTGVFDGGGVLFARNKSTSTNPGTASVRGYLAGTQDGVSAVRGHAGGGSGANFGVSGVNESASVESAGVLGVAGGTVPVPSTSNWSPTGVRGDSVAGNGVLGRAQGFGFGVGGYIVDGSGAVVRGGQLGSTSMGVEYVGGLGGTGTKSFYEPHPTDPGKMIRYVALEGPEAGTYFRGRGFFTGGRARIEVPESFRLVTDLEGLTVHLTPIGRLASVAVVSIGLDVIEVESSRDVEFSYIVHGVRRAYRDFEVIVPNTAYKPASAGERIPLWLSPDERQRVIDNGTFHADGTVNMATAEREGWVREWREREERARAAAARPGAACPQDSGPGAVTSR